MDVISIHERWLRASLFLSLDVTAPFLADLWVPVDDPARFQSELRDLLRPCLKHQSFYSDRPAHRYRLMDWFLNHTTPTDFEAFSCWIRNVLVLEGPDRVAETLWSSLTLRRISSHENNHGTPQWIALLMEEVRNEQQKKRAELEKKIDSVDDRSVSKWDKQVFRLQETSADAAITKLSLMRKYNILVEVWESHCCTLSYSQLYDLWQWAKGMANELGMEGLELPFPGIWRFELSNLTHRFVE